MATARRLTGLAMGLAFGCAPTIASDGVRKGPRTGSQLAAAVPTAIGDAQSTCDALHERHQQTLRALPPLPPACTAADYLSTNGPFSCKDGQSGAWAMVAKSVKQNLGEGRSKDDCFMGFPTLTSTLVHRSKAGVETDGPEFETATWYNGRREASIVAVFDYDGDGTPEAISDQESHEESETSPHHYKVHAVRNGSIIDYPPARGLVLAGVEDVDRDGRPDLLLLTHVATASHDGRAGTDARFIGLAHSLPAGLFSLADGVVRAFYRSRCPSAPSSIVARNGNRRDDVATGTNIVCARAWGAPEVTVATALQKSCPIWSREVGDGDPEDVPLETPCPYWWKDWLVEAKDYGLRR